MVDKRQELIKRYEKIIERWDKPNNSLRIILPDKYKEIKEKLQLLKDGYDFIITDETPWLRANIGLIASKFPSINYSEENGIKRYHSKGRGFDWEEAKRVEKELYESIDDKYN